MTLVGALAAAIAAAVGLILLIARIVDPERKRQRLVITRAGRVLYGAGFLLLLLSIAGVLLLPENNVTRWLGTTWGAVGALGVWAVVMIVVERILLALGHPTMSDVAADPSALR